MNEGTKKFTEARVNGEYVEQPSRVSVCSRGSGDEDC